MWMVVSDTTEYPVCLRVCMRVFKSAITLLFRLVLVSFTLAFEAYFFHAYCIKFASLELEQLPTD